jgi:sulfate/thiosulfate transport system substrate-binding protein
VTLVAYSTPREAYAEIIPLFQATEAGNGVEFEESYGGSGDQSRAVEAGLPADFVEFSLAPDMDRLVTAGLVAADWNSNQYKGMVSDSIVVFVVRKGNPKNIHTWDDLIQPGVGVITPNPFTSGGARWNVLAGWGAKTQTGSTEEEATAYLESLFANVLVQDASARASLQTFVAGQGDVLLAYENEAILAQQGGQDIEIVVPDDTLLIENPAAVTSSGGDATTQAKAFLDYLYTPEAQQVFANNGYRPIIQGVTPTNGITLANPSGLFTIDDLGGWSAINTKFFDKTNGIMADIERGLGINP